MDLLAAAAREIEEWKHLQRKQFSEELAKVGPFSPLNSCKVTKLRSSFKLIYLFSVPFSTQVHRNEM